MTYHNSCLPRHKFGKIKYKLTKVTRQRGVWCQGHTMQLMLKIDIEMNNFMNE